ncbi:helix-turn-helix domain-containing protein [Natronorubrum halophilum]|uniref:helix-turn-helix domain-containing protein n=1 Tax=Natronorubrum halophilum TaxID=1702106 RepID=UPI0010C2220F|nr:helix-turn-helix domain-containing protein [Natronorubrum halophilum]
MPHVRLKVELPRDSLVTFSIDHPDDEFRILTAHRTAETLRVVIEAETSDSDDLVRTLEAAAEVRSCEVLRTDRRGVLLQVETEEHEPRVAARTAGMLPQYPMSLRDGWQTIETIVSWDRLSQLNAEFERADVSFEIISITQPVEMTDLLTDRQWDVITEAITRGYYDTPRRCSLTDLATALDVNPSAVSGVLHRAEERIIKEFVAEAKPVDGLEALD